MSTDTKSLEARIPRWQTDPTNSEVQTAYKYPAHENNWVYVSDILGDTGFDVGIYNFRGQSEFGVAWPTEALQKKDYFQFFNIAKIVISTLRLNDEVYTTKVLPQIYTFLEKTTVYELLSKKESLSQGNSVVHHIQEVPKLVNTAECSIREKFVLRMSAIFHDFGKMFDIGRDQLHFHALVSADIFKRFMAEYEEQIFVHLLEVEKRNNGQQDEATLKQSFRDAITDTTEIIRLHHVLEQIDKKRLDPEFVAELFTLTGDEAFGFLLGLFVVADGGSVIPDNEKYAVFLAQNLDALAKVIAVLETENRFTEAEERSPDSIKYMFVQALQYLIERLSNIQISVKDLAEKIKAKIREIQDTLDRVLVVALLSLEVSEDPVVS